jgi:hypothetical protein
MQCRATKANLPELTPASLLARNLQTKVSCKVADTDKKDGASWVLLKPTQGGIYILYLSGL